MKTVCTLACLFNCLIFTLSSEEAYFSVDAKQFSYDSFQGTFEGKEVTLTFKEGSKLMSRKANLEVENRSAILSSEDPNEYVIFTGTMKRGNEALIPLVVKSKTMTMHVEGEEKDESEFLEIQAVGEVEIDYDKDFSGYGSLATFRTEAKEFDRLTELSSPGVITLKGEYPDSLCRIEHKRGDVIEALRLKFDPFENNVFGWKVQGNVASLGSYQHIDFHSDQLKWSPDNGSLELKGHISIHDEEFGKLHSLGRLEITQNRISQSDNVESIICIGETRIEHLNGEHSLVSFGEMTVNHNAHQVVIESPVEPNGEVHLTKQAYFEDSMGKIYANRFIIDYNLDRGSFAPVEILIEGNVRMHNHYLPDEKMRTMLEQYAIADLVKYCPKTKEMVLRATKGKKVLYYDKAQGVQVSAPGLYVQRGANQEIEIKGKGNVRMKFTPDEVASIRELFPFSF